MRSTFGRIALVFGVVAVLALGIWSFLPRPVPAETAVVTRGKFVATVDEDGKTHIRERYVVAVSIAGRLGRIRLKAGDSVKPDDVVASVQPAPAAFLDPRSRVQAEERLGNAEALRERTKSRVERAQAEAAQAKADLDRTRALAQSGVSPVRTLEHAELAMRIADRDLRAAQFEDHAAEHAVEEAKALLARYQEGAEGPPERWDVTAPVSGLVLKVVQVSETIVQPGTPIIELGDPLDLEIVVDVLSTDAVEIRPGAEVAIEHWGGPQALAGRVRRVEPAAFTKISPLGVEEQRVNVLIDLVSPPDQWAGLGEAYRVDARITVWAADDAIVVPAGALFRSGETWEVYAVTDGRAQLRPVSLIRRSGRVAAVSAGLQPGETLVVSPSNRIAPGVRVEVR